MTHRSSRPERRRAGGNRCSIHWATGARHRPV